LGINCIQMNRLIIVGNGFDLAHGLPTGYCDFIDWYWNCVISSFEDLQGELYEDDLIEIKLRFKRSSEKVSKVDFKNVQKLSQLESFVRSYSEAFNPEFGEQNYDRCYLKFHNSFFESICNKRSIQNWVDIENEYFKLLKDCLKEEGSNSKVTKLNQEFTKVKNLLEKYLNDKITEKFDFNKVNEQYQKILKLLLVKPLNLKDNLSHPYLREFQIGEFEFLMNLDKTIVESNRLMNLQSDIDNGKINQLNLILNFNYTQTIDKYVSAAIDRSGQNRYTAFGHTQQVQIHGRLKDSENQINFGFGDEMDDHYKLIENKDDNEYLKNIKSFQYLQNSNYREMLDFIDGEKFQVYIMGHSCGLSDRILLNKIFEHHNCRSIKVFYHQFDEPKADGRTDNYTEIVQNISRHFNKKEMMREKIVNKSLCQPLPQDIRFAPKENGSQL